MYNTKKSTVNGLGTIAPLTNAEWLIYRNIKPAPMVKVSATNTMLDADSLLEKYEVASNAGKNEIENLVRNYIQNSIKATELLATPTPTTTSSLDLSKIDERYLVAGGLVAVGAAYWLTKKMVMPLVVAAIGGAIYYKINKDQK